MSTSSTPATFPLILNVPTTRLRVRRIDEDAIAAHVASMDGQWHARVTNGGGVANAYKYPADTEAALAVCDSVGRVIVWMGRLPASKVTRRGSAKACLSSSCDLFDDRLAGDSDTSMRRRKNAWAAIKRAFRLEVARRTVAGDAIDRLAPEALTVMTDAEFELLVSSEPANFVQAAQS